MEFLKSDCSKISSDGQPCTECKSNEWISPPMCRIPRPMPDVSKLPEYHYKDVFQCCDDNDEEVRPPDDWQPRHNIKQREKKNLRQKDRLEKRQEKQQKGFDQYNWDTLCRSGEIQKLNIQELEKYLNHFKLSLKGKKYDKVRRVIAHVFYKQHEALDTYNPRQDPEVLSDIESSDSGEESDSEDDIVAAHYSSTESSERADNAEENNPEENLVPVLQLPRQTRSGRNIETSFSRYRDFFLF
ncbi:hypothetical protein ACROYT_G028930 [Oculina patagonica]